MARQKKLSAILEKAAQRHSALTSIDPALDLGNGLTLAAFRAEIENARALQDEYNALLSQVDGTYNRFQEAEISVRDLSQRMLAGVGVRFGMNSHEYEKAGGTRKSERKRPARRAVTA
ncbi:MAG: hypothetical protein K8S20_11875 [Chloroflexi bacterium]|nr:hypothetical protein [Chloroflexota bacterium]